MGVEPELLVDVPIVVPTVERVIERPIVSVDVKVHQVTGCVEKIVGETEVVEDRYVVDVPKVVPVPVETVEKVYIEKVCPHIRRIEQIVEVPQEQTCQKIVEVPQINTKTTIRHVPKFVDNGCRSVISKTAEDCAEEELHTARFLIQELELQRLSCVVSSSFGSARSLNQMPRSNANCAPDDSWKSSLSVSLDALGVSSGIVAKSCLQATALP